MRRLREWVIAGLPLAALLIGAAGCSGRQAEPGGDTRPSVDVSVESVAEQSFSDGLEVTAGVVPLTRATPGTVLMGRVDRVLVEEGDVVTRGQALASIESRDVAARIAQARAGVAAARAMEQNALRMRERMERLHARDAASEKDLEDATAGHEAALAELAAAEEAVKAAEVQLDYARIVAPFDGVVVEKRIQPGDLATPGVPLFVIDDVHRVKIEAQVPETDASRVSLGDPVRVRFRDAMLEARVSELVPAADPRSRTFTVRAMVDNPDLQLRPGMFARLTLAGGERAALAIPSRAVVRRGPLTGVFVVETGPEGGAHARLRWITLGEDRGDRVEVLTGLEAGERIVVEPVTQLSDGQPVEVAG